MVKRIAFVASVVLDAGMAYGADLATLSFEHPFEGRGSFVDWAEWTTAVMALLMLMIAVITFFFGRQRWLPSQVNFLRFVGLCALPIFVLVVGTFANFEGSKRVAFCQSCHTAMDLYVDDMRDVKSETLAARHYQNRYIQENQCYKCHADYGVHGAVGAKTRGLQHLYYWVTNSATARGEAQIKLYDYFSNEFCLHCHAGSQKFLKIDDHIDFKDDMLQSDPDTGEPVMSCMDCHGPAHKSLADLQSARKGES
ncbi:MAG: NapC/NirT family cytochrome c [Candidatus Tectomicrobia bacterium]|nr:NapC/NirT family cytochrome c [Candidatus Tectomicrobia bacterium]